MNTPTIDEPIEWRHGEGCALEYINGYGLFRYHPSEMRMEWHGRNYYGVASEDIDAFVRNREGSLMVRSYV